MITSALEHRPHRGSAELRGVPPPSGASGPAQARATRLAIAMLGLMGGIPRSAPALEWSWLHPHPHGANVVDLAKLGARYLQVGESGQIYASTNRVVWEPVSSGTTRELRGVTTLGLRWLVVGENGLVLWSDDGAHFEVAAGMPATTRWLEGVAASSTVAVAVGDAGAIYRTEEGVTWTVANEGGSAAWLTGVAFGGGLFVAVGETGTILTSADGRDWTRRPSGVTADLARVTYGAGRFVAVGDQGTVLTSRNGQQWESLNLPAGEGPRLFAAASTEFGILVVGEAAVYFRPNLSPGWQNHLLEAVSPAPAPEWTFAAAHWDGEEFLIAGHTGVTTIGAIVRQVPVVVLAWLRADESPRSQFWDLERFGEVYLAVGDVSTVFSSVAGAGLDPEVLPGTADTVLFGVGGSDVAALAVGSGGVVWRSPGRTATGVATNQVEVAGVVHEWTTTNTVNLLGLVWERVAVGLTQETLQGVGWNGSQFVVVGANGALLRSPDGTNWVAGALPSAEFFSSVAASPDRWVAVGSRGALFESRDAMAWNHVPLAETNWIYRVRWEGGRWSAVGQRGLFFDSTNGLAWNRRATGTDAWLTDVQQVSGMTWVCGTQGSLLRSADLVRWESVETPTGKAFHALASRGEELLLAGAEGVCLRLLLDAPVTPVGIAQHEYRVTPAGAIELFRLDGMGGRVFRLESTGNLQAWGTTHTGRMGVGGGALIGREAREPAQWHRTVIDPN